jgi:hypothetical protein
MIGIKHESGLDSDQKVYGTCKKKEKREITKSFKLGADFRDKRVRIVEYSFIALLMESDEKNGPSIFGSVELV